MTTPWPWLAFTLFVLILLALDLGVLHRKAREVTVREALWLSLGYLVLALGFAWGVFHFQGAQAGAEFLTGYLIEKSLSIDNIFVFLLIFRHFEVPGELRHTVLFWGVLGALAMRAALILAGAAALAAFHWVIYVFGALLVATGVRMLLAVDAEPDMAGNRLVLFLRRRLRVTGGYEGARFFVRREGALFVTPLLLVLALAEFSDAVFALDSIPAIFAITRDPFLVYTSNVFAILGLRALFFALAGVIERFRYLKHALSLVLVLVGGKMLVNGFFGPVIPTHWALIATLLVLSGGVAFSLWRTRAAAGPDPAPRGWVPGSPAKNETHDPDGRGEGS